MQEFGIYRGFAQVYDLFMDNVPYEAWRDYLVKELKKAGIEEGLVLDLGCGTGRMTRLLAQSGYDMIGVDASEEMLMLAREADGSMGTGGILYLLQDMRRFELYGTVRAAVSVCDSMNYLMEEEDLKAVFSLVNNYLDPGGIFIFDLNTIYKYEHLLADRTICENREEGSFIWENYYEKEERVNEYDLTLFIREEDSRRGDGGLYRKYEETHFQRAYGLDTVKRLIGEAGLMFAGACDAEDGGAVRADSTRIYIIAKECQKGEK